MILHNLYITGQPGLQHIHILEGKIFSIFADENKIPNGETIIECEGALAFPGLINSHDHIDFNLFPQTGNRIYNNYTEWGKDIHEQNKETINEVLKVPEELRVKWGLYKNLLNGITTVINHGKKLVIENDLINVIQPASLHSPEFEKGWKWKLNDPFLKGIITMHIGEGTDQKAAKEIDEVIRWNFFKKKIVAIHGVAMKEKQAASFHGLVWCPASNFFLLNKTASIDKLKDKIKILFGTDSTLTASWNLWEHIRLAREQKMLNDNELFNSLTSNAAGIWKLNSGSLSENKVADIVVVKIKGRMSDFDSFYSTNPEDILLVMRNGNAKLIDEKLVKDSLFFSENGFDRIVINENKKYIYGNVHELTNDIHSFYSKIKPLGELT